MYLSSIKVENFRCFGSGDGALEISFNKGLTALVGENDAGKSAIIDAIRYALRTRDQEFLRVREEDFHVDATGLQASEILIVCKIQDFNPEQASAFIEYLTYEETSADGRIPVLWFNWRARRKLNDRSGRGLPYRVEVTCGMDGQGPSIDIDARELLEATYLRPLRDAQRELSAGRGSRLAQILKNISGVDSPAPDTPILGANVSEASLNNLSVLGIGALTDELLSRQSHISQAKDHLNSEYLERLSFENDPLRGNVAISDSQLGESQRLRKLLEQLILEVGEFGVDGNKSPDDIERGLGTQNLLYLACEMLLLENDKEGLPVLLIEEPEAHLHPQRQLKLLQFLQAKCQLNDPPLQVIVTTHSPNLSSVIRAENVAVVTSRKAYSLAKENTKLSPNDYNFLNRFLDVTKANLFFARGVLIVEGDAEAILLPTIAKFLGYDLADYGISIVNVGHTGLGRYARLFQHADNPLFDIPIPVACVADFDVLPDCKRRSKSAAGGGDRRAVEKCSTFN